MPVLEDLSEPDAPPASAVPMPNFSFSSLQPSPIPAAASNESEADLKERTLLKAKLKRYEKEFPCVSALALNFEAPLPQLRNQLDEVRALIQNKTTGILLKRTYLTGVSTLEVIGKKTHTAKLDGLSDLLARSAEVDECLKQLACEIEIGYISPVKKLAFITVSSAYVLHTLNCKSEIFNEFAKEGVKPFVAEAYKDL